MNYTETEWNGFPCTCFEFHGRKAILVRPKQACKEMKWLFKTEYFEVFPSFQLEMLEKL